VHFIQDPVCITCGTPQPFLEENVNSCNNCEGKNFAFDSAQSATVYNDFTKSLVMRLKHGDATYLARLFASWLQKMPLPEKCLLVPVPLHWTRLLRRQFNQSALIAIHLEKLMGPSFFISCPPVLKRKRRTKPQGKQGATERFENLDGAFCVPEKNKSYLKNTGVILIDDVLTSGATVHTCAKTLKEAGCPFVHVVTVARVVKG
jgi:ComF family protein